MNNTTVGDVMTLEVVSIPPEASVWEAASLMHRREVRRLPVVDADDYVVGVLTRSDLVRAMARSDEEIAASVQKAFGVLGRENFLALQVEPKEGRFPSGGLRFTGRPRNWRSTSLPRLPVCSRSSTTSNGNSMTHIPGQPRAHSPPVPK